MENQASLAVMFHQKGFAESDIPRLIKNKGFAIGYFQSELLHPCSIQFFKHQITITKKPKQPEYMNLEKQILLIHFQQGEILELQSFATDILPQYKQMNEDMKLFITYETTIFNESVQALEIFTNLMTSYRKIQFRCFRSREDFVDFVERIGNKILRLPFDTPKSTFNKADKSEEAKDLKKEQQIFMDMLINVDQISLEKAFAIAQKFPTLNDLFNFYEKKDQEGTQKAKREAAEIFQNLIPQFKKKALGPKLSQKLFDLYNSTDPNFLI